MTLTSLPTELIELIVPHLDIDSLRSIRLTCSSLQAQTVRHFKQRCFRQQRLRWNKRSFDKLLLINDHPVFGNILQTLIIDATPRHSISIWRLSRRLSATQAIVSDSSAEIIVGEITHEHAIECKNADDDATYFNESRYDRKCLETVFRSLGSIHGIIFSYEGMDRKYSKFGRRYCESSQHEMSRPFVSTMASIASSGVTVRQISLHDTNHHGAVSIGRLESLAPYLRNFDTTFANLHTLKLNLRDWRYPDSGFELDTDRAPFVIRFLAKAQNVRVLDISCYSSLEDDLFGEMARCCSFPWLEECTLSVFRINNAADLTSFLTPCSSTLRTLTLNNIRLTDETTTWQELLRELAEADILHVLREFCVRNLFTQFGSRMFVDGTHTKWRFVTREGQGTWRGMLEDTVARFMEGGYGPAWHLAAVAYPFVRMGT